MAEGEGSVATLEPVNIAPPGQATPETVEAAIPEQVVADTPDAADSDTPEEQEGPNLEGLTDDQLAELPQVKSLLARREQSAQDRARMAEQQRAIEQGAVAFDNQAKETTEQAMGQTVQSLLAKNKAWAQMYADGREGVDSPAPPLAVIKDDLTKYAQQADTLGQLRMVNAATAALMDQNWYGKTLSKDELAWRDEARGNWKIFWERHNALIEAAAINQYEAKQAEAARKGAKGEADVANLQANARERATQPQPTRVAGGTASGLPTTMVEADAAYNAGRINHEQYKQYREKFSLGAAPGGRG